MIKNEWEIDHVKSKKQNGKGDLTPFPFCQQPL
jgi:hypothetical protein